MAGLDRNRCLFMRDSSEIGSKFLLCTDLAINPIKFAKGLWVCIKILCFPSVQNYWPRNCLHNTLGVQMSSIACLSLAHKESLIAGC